MKETTVRRHPRRGTRGVKRHSRKISSERKTVPHNVMIDWEYTRVTRRMRRLERKFNELTKEKNNIIKQLSITDNKGTFRNREKAHDRIRAIDRDLSAIGKEWGMLGIKGKYYFVRKGTQIEKFVDKQTRID
ncbi:MAG: hypothetical protein KAQ85_08705 [Thermodesulfovibrionia bacterium]|nr:hypothetical protein [Thermodesulfovibrionia bacterium]